MLLKEVSYAHQGLFDDIYIYSKNRNIEISLHGFQFEHIL